MTTLTTTKPSYLAYAEDSDVEHFAWWCAEHCRHFLGPFAGQPLVLEPWQLDFFGEVLAIDARGLPYWRTVVKIVSRKNGKTTEFAALGCYHVDQEEGGPNVGLAATSDEQASELFDACDAFIAASPYLSDRFHVRDYDGEIARSDGGGYMRRMRMNWRRLHGKNQSRLLADELHAWTTPNLRRCWEALTTGDGARPDFQALCITSEGEPDPDGEGILASLVQQNERYGDVERRPGLVISRDHESRTLIWRYSSPMPDADPAPVREAHRRWRDAVREDAAAASGLKREYDRAVRRCVRAVKLANPASWISEDYLRRKAVDPKITRSAFLRFHACVAASSDEAWIRDDVWSALAVPGRPAPLEFVEPGRALCLGLDGSRTHDSTVLAWAARAGDWPDGDWWIDVDARIYAVTAETPHHVLYPGRIDYEDFEEDVVEAFRTWDVREAAYDERYLQRSADILTQRLHEDCIAAVAPSSQHMRDAIAAFDRLVVDGRIRHRGDPAVSAHVLAARAIRDPDSGEIRKLRKPSDEVRIDAAVAMALAVWRELLRPDGSEFFLY